MSWHCIHNNIVASSNFNHNLVSIWCPKALHSLPGADLLKAEQIQIWNFFSTVRVVEVIFLLRWQHILNPKLFIHSFISEEEPELN